MKHPLMQLMARNRGRGSFRADIAPGADEATLYVYDMIVGDEFEAEFWGGVSPMGFLKQLAAIDAPVIHLRINSPGGDVFAARAIEQAIREHSARVIAHIDGLAASAASYLALAADEVVMAPGAFYMIHRAWTIAGGNATDFTQTAALLEKLDSSLADTYASATGQSKEQVMQWLDAETWFSAQEAVDAGFATRIAETSTKAGNGAGNAAATWDLSVFSHAPRAAAATPATQVKNELSARLNGRQVAIYTAFEDIAEEFGAFDASTGADGAHLMPAAQNPFAADGLKCASCAFYTGGQACELVAGRIDPDAICKLWVIPADLIGSPYPPNANTAVTAAEQAAIAAENAHLKNRLRLIELG